MKEGFEIVTYREGIKAKFNQNLTKELLYSQGAKDRDWFLDQASFVTKGNPSNGYLRRWERHQEYFYGA